MTIEKNFGTDKTKINIAYKNTVYIIIIG